MDRTHYIFIDYDNVTDDDLTRVTGKSVKVFMILGTRQTKLPTKLFLFSQDNPDRVRIIQTPVEGRSALDLVLALELGRLFKADPEAYFHIVSKDTDFESVVRHLKNETTRIARHVSLAEIPALRTPEERFARFSPSSSVQKDETRIIKGSRVVSGCFLALHFARFLGRSAGPGPIDAATPPPSGRAAPPPAGADPSPGLPPPLSPATQRPYCTPWTLH
jgi:hypothetical protein